jgi:hypothetical protein
MRKLAFAALSLYAGSSLAAPACFSPKDLEAAHLRALYQQFQVATLNCQTDISDPSAPTFRDRYTQFVDRFNAQMVNNSTVLKAHFGRAADLDKWITQIANDAGQAVISKPDFCQVNWDRLDAVVWLPKEEIGTYAVQQDAASDRAKPCPEKKAPAAKPKKK